MVGATVGLDLNGLSVVSSLQLVPHKLLFCLEPMKLFFCFLKHEGQLNVHQDAQ